MAKLQYKSGFLFVNYIHFHQTTEGAV